MAKGFGQNGRSFKRQIGVLESQRDSALSHPISWAFHAWRALDNSPIVVHMLGEFKTRRPALASIYGAASVSDLIAHAAGAKRHSVKYNTRGRF